MTPKPIQHAYIVGSGLASLAAAAYLIKGAHLPGDKITIFEAGKDHGGSLDGPELGNDKGYRMRGFRMLEDRIYTALFDLMSFIPSVTAPGQNLHEEYVAFNEKVPIADGARLIAAGKRLDAHPMTLSRRDRWAGIALLFLPERFLQGKQIDQYFSADFFESNFWYEVCTIFSFQPWHSLIEFKRYLVRFLQDAPTLDTVTGMRSTPYNQYDSLALPVSEWLKEQGVVFQDQTVVTNVDFETTNGKRRATGIDVLEQGQHRSVPMNSDDLVFITVGSMVAQSSFGSMDEAPVLNTEGHCPEWNLWEAVAADQPDFGRPGVFRPDIEQTKWISFTITCRSPEFFRRVEELSGSKAGEGGPMTFPQSPWLFFLDLPHQPHYRHQPDGIFVCQGYALFPEREGTYVQKKMSDCTGAEVFRELCGHLGLTDAVADMLPDITCIPCLMPYITSQFMPRRSGDRPKVVPDGAVNFAFLGEYVEIPDDIVFTLEYAVRSAQIAVHKLTNSERPVTKLYHAKRHLSVLLSGLRAVFR